MMNMKLLELEHRIERLENARNKQQQEELWWAIDELTYMEKNDEQKKAWNIVFPLLQNILLKGYRTTPLRPKSVKKR